MRILFLGDIVGKIGRNAVKANLPSLIKKHQIDFVISNAENATHGKGLIEKHYEELLSSGVDAITLGNHYRGKYQIDAYIDDALNLVRPLNLLNDFGGEGTKLFDVNGVLVRVSNVLGASFMKEEVKSPYQSLNELLEDIKDEDSIHIVDFHAEATGEKMCFGYVFDGRVSAVIGTHTHTQTNDAKILDKGTAFISDAGMCGSNTGVLGFERNSVINKTIFGNNERFTLLDQGEYILNGVVIDVDEVSKKSREIFLIKIIGE